MMHVNAMEFTEQTDIREPYYSS